MTFRITLFNDTDSIEINEPDGLRDAVIKLDRDDNFHSLVQFFEGAFIFYGEGNFVNGGFHFIKQTEIDFGPDADLRALIEIAPDDETFSVLHDGQFKLSDLEEMPDNKIKVPIIRDDFWAKFISRLDTPVNIQSPTNLDNDPCDAQEAISLQLSSQVVKYSTIGRLRDSYFYGPFFVPFDIKDYLQIDWDEYDLDEVTTKYTYPIAFNDEDPFEKYSVEYAGEYYLKIRLYMTHASVTIGGLGAITFDGWYDLTRSGPDIEVELLVNNQASGLIFTQTDLGTDGTDGYSMFFLEGTLTLKAHDKITIRGRVITSSLFFPMLLGVNTENTGELVHEILAPPSEPIPPDFPSGLTDDNEFTIIALTIFPETNAPSFLLHDVAGAIIDRITGTEEKFYSEFLGSEKTLYKQYDEDGCQWTNALTRGLQLRQYTLSEKPFSISFKKWWDGANPILNIGLGYEEINGEQVIRVEEKSHFYNQSSGTSFDFSNVRDIVRKYDNDRIFNKVEIGYARWESEDISGIDDPQSKRIYASRFKKIGQTITLLSEFIAASLAIETTRRTTREKSADYKYDNEFFLISINPTEIEESPATSPDVVTFQPELDENFSSITGLLNSETRYNIRHSVARMFLRWKDYLQGCLQSYIGSVFKFTSGQGNFDMASTMDLDCDVAYNAGAEVVEDQDFIVTDEIFHLCNLYEFTAPLEYEDFETIVANRKLPIGLSQSGTAHTPMFIKSLSYKVAHGEVTIQAWPTEFFDIQVQDDAVATQECFAMPGACEDGITDDNGIQIVDENGICIIA